METHGAGQRVEGNIISLVGLATHGMDMDKVKQIHSIWK